MTQVIILGDVHLGAGTNLGKVSVGSNLNSRISDQLNLLDWTLEQAIEQLAEHIVVTGDIFEDPKPHPSLITLFLSWLKKCQAHHVHVHLISGNHDVLRNGFVYSSPLDIISEADLDYINVYKDINTIFIDTSAFTFVPFRDRKSLGLTSNLEAIETLKNVVSYELLTIPSTYNKILIGHLAIEGSLFVGNEVDDISNELFCPLDMFSGYNYVWMGHVHKPQVLNKNNPYVAHIGSMDISNFGETDHNKHIIIYNCIENSFKKMNLPTRSLKKINIVVPQGTEDCTQYVVEELKKINEDFNQSIVKLEVSLASPELKSVNKSVIEKQLVGSGAFNVAMISEAKKTILVQKDQNNTLNTKMDVSSAINKYVSNYLNHLPADKKGAVLDLALEIYNSHVEEAKE